MVNVASGIWWGTTLGVVWETWVVDLVLLKKHWWKHGYVILLGWVLFLHCEVMKYYATGEDLAKDMGVALSVIEQVHEAHYEAAKKTEKDPDGGSWPAYPSGKSWDEASGKTGSGKKFYHNIIPGSAVKSEPFYVAIITPVIHYCMGGLLIDTDSACIGANNQAIPGLYAAGEVAGGVHGNNRLGGNSLLDRVVFGRVAGRAAAKYMLGADFKEVDLRDVSGGGLTGAVESSKLAGGSYEDKMNSATVPAAGAGGAAAAPAAGGGGGISMADVAKHNSKTDCWVVVDGQVLDVTSFLGDHPGGELAILTFAGKDATEEFNMSLGHIDTVCRRCIISGTFLATPVSSFPWVSSFVEFSKDPSSRCHWQVCSWLRDRHDWWWRWRCSGRWCTSCWWWRRWHFYGRGGQAQ